MRKTAIPGQPAGRPGIYVRRTGSDGHEFLFLGRDQLVDVLGVFVGEILNGLLGVFEVVLGDLALLLLLLGSLERRSSVSCGKTRRIRRPSFCGLMPRSEVWMAFSMGLSRLLSQGEMVSVRASGEATVATWPMGVSAP